MGISDRGTKAKSIASCDNAFVTNLVLARDPAAQRMFSVRKRSANVAPAPKAAHRMLPGSFALCESVVLTKRQQQSVQPERKSPPCYDDELK
ncbi:hypothetical protein ABE61_19810 [Lysinibacillus sphaericus]|nr:hypothetical protein [Lysinibacillus sphaericus]MBG9479218.1 hypothetical protein [Lysinibacillus sphaericus]MBG9591484.1 hypothetical protein [Lysinibacillus sphaericus]